MGLRSYPWGPRLGCEWVMENGVTIIDDGVLALAAGKACFGLRL